MPCADGTPAQMPFRGAHLGSAAPAGTATSQWLSSQVRADPGAPAAAGHPLRLPGGGQSTESTESTELGCGAARGEQQGHGLTRAECVQEAWGRSGPTDPRDEWSGLCPVH